MRTFDISVERKFEFLNSQIICSLRKAKHILNKYCGQWEHEMTSKIRQARVASLRTPRATDKKDSAGNILTYDVIFTISAQLSTC